MKRILLMMMCLILITGCSLVKKDEEVVQTPSDTPSQMEEPATQEETLEEEQQKENDWLCISGERVGPINGYTSEEDLKRFFGEENVVRKTMLVAEGTEEITASVIFEGTKDEIQVWWDEERAFEKPYLVLIREVKGAWQTPEGIAVGTTLEDLNKHNKIPFHISGFGWDYGGYVVDWRGGELEGLGIRLTYENVAKDITPYLGDGVTISSDDTGLSKLGVNVWEMIIQF